MNLYNSKPRRAFEDAMCVIGVIDLNGNLLHSETKEKVDFGAYAKQAFTKFGPCRVAFKPQGVLTWREVRWKNKNSGSLYRRPSYVTLDDKHVPDLLKLMDMIV